MTFSVLSGIESVSRREWSDFIRNHPGRTVFQSPEMYDLYRATPQYEPYLLSVKDEDSHVLAILLAVLIRDYKGIAGKFTSRVVVQGGPLIRPGLPNARPVVTKLLGKLVSLTAGKCIFIQFRNSCDLSEFADSFQAHSFLFHPHLNLIIPTADPDGTLREISKRKMHQVRQSLHAGARLERATRPEEVSQFYAILKKVYRFKVRKPLAPESLFQGFLEASREDRPGFILLVKQGEKVIGGMVCALTEGRSLTEWYICGLDREYKKIHPSVLVTYGAIKYALDNQIPAFDFLGIGRPGKPYGVRDFKLHFGGDVVNYGRYERINRPVLYFVMKKVLAVLGWMKLV